MKQKKDFSKLLRNKWVLNIVAFVSLINVIGYAMSNNLNAVAFFIVVALLVFYFSKNMIIVLGIPLILVNLFVYMNVMKEGLVNNTTASDPSGNDPSGNTVSGTSQTMPSNPTSRTPQGLSKTNIDETTSLNSSTNSAPNTSTDESFEVGRPKRGGGGYNIDYASTVEDAYDDLNKVLGGDGIKRLTGDTQRLMQQQMQLAEAMKGMTPLIQGMAPLMKQAQGLLGGMGSKEGLGEMMEMAKKFSGGQSPSA